MFPFTYFSIGGMIKMGFSVCIEGKIRVVMKEIPSTGSEKEDCEKLERR